MQDRTQHAVTPGDRPGPTPEQLRHLSWIDDMTADELRAELRRQEQGRLSMDSCMRAIEGVVLSWQERMGELSDRADDGEQRPDAGELLVAPDGREFRDDAHHNQVAYVENMLKGLNRGLEGLCWAESVWRTRDEVFDRQSMDEIRDAVVDSIDSAHAYLDQWGAIR